MDNGAKSTLPDNGNSIHLSDVIDVIKKDACAEGIEGVFQESHSMSNPTRNARSSRGSPYIKILEQPASKALRFRYECEGRSAGSIPGISSTPENKTYPTIQIVGYRGRAVVVVSCVTKDPPYRPHPHNLVGKEGCKKGICTLELNNESMTASFSNLGIQCVKKKDVDEALKIREEIRVDPFRTGFSHRSQSNSMDLNAVRLCFQAFLDGSERGKFNVLTPVVSEPIYDKKAMSDLTICKLSDVSAPVIGGKEIILLCEKVAKEDIQVRFYEAADNKLVWEAYGEFAPSSVHKQVAIAFRTPRYKTIQVDRPINVRVQLRRPSDGETSEPLPFFLTPLDTDPAFVKRKRLKYSNDYLIAQMQQARTAAQMPTYNNDMLLSPDINVAAEPSTSVPIKSEPPCVSPASYALHGHNMMVYQQLSPMQYNITSRTPSPLEYHQANSPVAPNAATATTNVYQSPSPATPVNVFQCPSPANALYIQQQQTTSYPQQSLYQNSMNAFKNNEGMVGENEYVTNVNQFYGGGEMMMMDDGSSLNRLDSKDLAELSLLDANLSANLSNCLNLDDGPKEQNETPKNMTDSLTRLVNSAFDEHYANAGNAQ